MLVISCVESPLLIEVPFPVLLEIFIAGLIWLRAVLIPVDSVQIQLQSVDPAV